MDTNEVLKFVCLIPVNAWIKLLKPWSVKDQGFFLPFVAKHDLSTTIRRG